MHRDGPIRFNHCLPYLREDDFSIWADQIVVSLRNVRTDYFDMQEGLLYELLHTLILVSTVLLKLRSLSLPPTLHTGEMES